MAAKPAKELTSHERRFALQYLFQANPVHMIGRYPRYHELWERFHGAGDSAERAEKYFQAQDFTDLQVLSQIAWFDEFFLDQPDIAALIKKGRGFSLEDQAFVITRQRALVGEVLPAHAKAAQQGRIEISTSPFYHPILPLVCDTNMGAVSTPGLPLPQNRFLHPEDAREQLQRGLDLHQQVFGVKPVGRVAIRGQRVRRGFVHRAKPGCEVDGHRRRRSGTKSRNQLRARRRRASFSQNAEKLYNIHRFESGSTQMHLIFRDHTISDLVGFVYSGMPPQDAANHLIHNIKQAAQPLLNQGRDAVVSVILDGENAWEYYPRSGREFLRRFYDALQREPGIEAVYRVRSHRPSS